MTPDAPATPAGPDAPAPEQITPSWMQVKILETLDQATQSLTDLDAQIARDRAQQQQAVDAFALLAPKDQQAVSDAGLAPRAWEKSAQRDALEDRRRAAKKRMRDCITYLCERQLYSVQQIESIMASDGAGVLFAQDQVAIGRADVLDAVASCEYPKTRRAFVLRHKFGKSNAEIAAELGVVSPDHVNWLCNRAVDHIHLMLNAPLVSHVRAQFFNFCLAHGLEFPEYADLRGR